MTINNRFALLLVGSVFGTAAAMLQALAAPQAPSLQRFEFHELHMGTRFRIVTYAADRSHARRGADEAFRRITKLDHIMSDYNQASELMQLCRRSGGPPVPVSPDLFAVLVRAQELSRRTDGAFDVTVGPLSRLWRRARRRRQLPDADRLEQARRRVGFHLLHLEPKARTVRLDKVGMRLDLGGIAKGYAADAALAVLKKHGLGRSLVAAGGDIRIGQPPPGRSHWRVGIAPLDDPDQPPRRFLLLTCAAVSTSGDAEQFVEIDGERYSHILDPRTGLGLLGRRSVTVVAPDATTSDSLATAVSVLGPEAGLRLVDQTPGAAAFIIEATREGKRRYRSQRWGDIRQETAGRPKPR